MPADAPRILLLDIETLPNVVTSWGLKVDGYLSHDNILEERTILCAAWKWLGEKRVHAVSQLSAKGPRAQADRGILRKLHKVLASADVVIAHHGDRFDLPWIFGRMVILGMKPPRRPTQIDTKKIAKAAGYFNSNRLDYLGKILGVGQKIKTEFGLWLDCMPHQPKATRAKAIREMVRYNREDVRLLERVYLKLRPFVTAKINLALSDGNDRTCPTCGAEELKARGFGSNRVSRYARFQCAKCGAWSSRPLTSKTVR